MSQQEQLQAENDEISLIDILLFFKASGGNIAKSTCACLLAGGIYYFFVPKMYEATASIEMATVAGQSVETPMVLLEKMKLPLYFSPATLQACGSDSGFRSQAKFFDKITPTISKSAQFISLSIQALSTQQAQACLNAVISDIHKSQNELAKTLIEEHKQKIANLSDQIKLTKDMTKSFPTTKANNTLTEAQLFVNTLMTFSNLTIAKEIGDLNIKISALENALIPPQTQSSSLVVSIFAPDAPKNQRPMFTLGLFLASGVFLGLLITGLQRVAPEICRQMRRTQAKRG